MLFAVKNRVGPALLMLVALVAGALLAREGLGLRWRLELSPSVAWQVPLGLGVVLLSDGLVQNGLWWALGDRYLARYRALAEYFRPQGLLQIAAGALLAGGGEELFFRGVLLEGLMSRTGLGPVVAVGASALVFGALHLIPTAGLAPFAIWAVWEGLLLGTFYVVTRSLLVLMLLHAAHDFLGFSLFAWQRRSGWGLGSKSFAADETPG